MGFKINPTTGKQVRGFAAMGLAQRTAVAAMGGAATPADKRAFSRDRELAAQAGAKGGMASGKARAATPSEA